MVDLNPLLATLKVEECVTNQVTRLPEARMAPVFLDPYGRQDRVLFVCLVGLFDSPLFNLSFSRQRERAAVMAGWMPEGGMAQDVEPRHLPDFLLAYESDAYVELTRLLRYQEHFAFSAIRKAEVLMDALYSHCMESIDDVGKRAPDLAAIDTYMGYAFSTPHRMAELYKAKVLTADVLDRVRGEGGGTPPEAGPGPSAWSGPSSVEDV